MKELRTKGFTLIELLLVVAIMGLMGTISVGGFRAMRRGMEQRSVIRNVSQFIRNAYQRAQIDRQTTVVFFWNEVKRDESDEDPSATTVGESVTKLIVGRAVAVRLSGRVSAIEGNALIDEFGDLAYFSGISYDSDGTSEYDEDIVKNGARMYIYKMSGSAEGGSWSKCRSLAAQATCEVNYAKKLNPLLLGGTDEKENFTVYGYYLPGGTGNWAVGDQYGFEISYLTLPNNYIFGDSLNVAEIADGPQDAGGAMWFYPKGANGSGSHNPITISSLVVGKNGEFEARPLPDKSEDPTKN